MLHGMDPKYIATPKDTVEALLESGNRRSGGVPLRKTFVQQGNRTAPQPGPLASLGRVHVSERVVYEGEGDEC